MNILIIYNRYNLFGGEDIYFDLIVRLLKKNGHKIFIYKKDNRDIPDTLLSKIKVSLNLLYNFQLNSELQGIIKKNKIELAFLLNIYPLIGNGIYPLLKSKKIKIIQRISNYRYACPKMNLFRNGSICNLCSKSFFFIPSIWFGCYHNSRMASFIFSFSFHLHRLLGWFSLVDAYIFPSSFIAEKYMETNIIAVNKIHVLPSFIDVHRNIHSCRQRRGIIFVGRLVEEKGVLTLLEIVKYYPHITFSIIGAGPLRNKIWAAAKKHKNVEFLSYLNKEKVLREISKAKVVIIPSLWYDVLPNVLIESYSTGTPVIAPNIGPFKSLIKNHKTGWLYEYKSVSSLREAIDKAVSYKGSIQRAINKEFMVYESHKHYDSLLSIFNKTVE